MFKLTILLCGLVAFAASLKIHDFHGYEGDFGHQEGGGADTEHHVEVEHKHATSHQSVKLHHYHPVTVHIKEDPHPVEIGSTKQKLKILHPETQKNHNHGLVLEDHHETHLGDHGHYQEESHYEHYHHE